MYEGILILINKESKLQQRESKIKSSLEVDQLVAGCGGVITHQSSPQ